MRTSAAYTELPRCQNRSSGSDHLGEACLGLEEAMGLLKKDLYLIGALLLVAAALWLGRGLIQSKGAFVLVTVNGKELERYSLYEDAEIEIVSGEHRNHMIIKDGAAQITQADCPDKICVETGSISFSGQSIVCLPNKVIVEIIGGKGGDEDVVAR